MLSLINNFLIWPYSYYLPQLLSTIFTVLVSAIECEFLSEAEALRV